MTAGTLAQERNTHETSPHAGRPAPSTRSDAGEMLRRLDRLSRATVSDDQFFKETVAELTSGLPLVAGVLWLTTPQGLLVPAAESGLGESGTLRDPAASRINFQRLADAVRNDRGSRFAGLNDDPQSDGPAVLIAPIKALRGCVGALEIFLRPDAEGEPTQWKDALDEAAQLVSRSLCWREETSSAERQLDFARRLEATSLALLSRTAVREAALVAVNDGRQLLQCDRLSLVVRHGSGVRVIAVTGQEQVHSRSNLVRAMAQLGRVALHAGKPLQYPDVSGETPRVVSDMLVRFIDQGTARAVCVVPLVAPPATSESRPTPQAKRPEPFGVLIAEHFTENWLTPVTAARTAWFGEHVALALHKARRDESVFLLPLWRAIGTSLSALRGTRFALTLVALLLIGAAAAFLVGHQAEYRVEGTGKLMPVVRRDVFAPWDGEVVDVKVRTGQRVEAGELLVELRNDELDSQILTARNRLAERQQAFHSLRAESDETAAKSMRSEDVLRLRGRLAQLRIEMEGLTQRVAALEKQRETLTIRAPIAGTVATFHVEQTLRSRPVRRGERLIELMDEDDAWRIEATVAERRAGHLLAARRASRDEPLAGAFVLATRPETTFECRMEEVATRTTLSEKDGSAVPVILTIDAARLPERRIGAEAAVKIDCGRKPLGYVLFGDVIEFVQRRLW